MQRAESCSSLLDPSKMKRDEPEKLDQLPVFAEKANTFFLHAKELFSLKKTGLAEEDFKKALTILSQHRDAIVEADWMIGETYKYLARIAISNGLPEEAREYFEQGRRCCSTHPTLFTHTIEFLQKEGQLKEAEDLCEQALKADDPEPECFSICAKVYESLGKWKEVLAICRRCLSKKELNKVYQIEMMDQIVKSLKELNFYQSAFGYMQRACEIDPSDARFQELLEDALLAKLKLPNDFNEKRLKGALTIIEEDIEEGLPKALCVLDEVLQDPDVLLHRLIDARLGRIRALIKMDKLNAAKEEVNRINLQTVSELRCFDISLLKASIWEKEGNPDQAESFFWEGYRICEKKNSYIEKKKRFLFIKEFLKLFISWEKFKEALNLCKIAEQSGILGCADSLDLQIRIYQAKGINSEEDSSFVREKCLAWLALSSQDVDRRVEILYLAAETSASELECYTHLLKAYEISLDQTKFSELENLHSKLQRDPIPQPLTSKQENVAAVVVNENPEKVIQMLGGYSFEVLTYSGLLSRARAYTKIGNFELAKNDLEQAKKCNPKPRHIWPWKSEGYEKWKQSQIKILLAFAEEAIAERKAMIEEEAIKEKTAEALAYFEEGWNLCKTIDLAQAYIKFLRECEKFSAALILCEKAVKYEIIFGSHYHLYRAEIFFAEENWIEAKASCEAFLLLKGVRKKQLLKIYEIGFESCMKMEDFRRAKDYAFWLYDQKTDPCDFIERSEKLLAAHRANIIEELLEKLLRNSHSLSTKNLFLSTLLRAYEPVFAVHRKKHAEIRALIDAT